MSITIIYQSGPIFCHFFVVFVCFPVFSVLWKMLYSHILPYYTAENSCPCKVMPQIQTRCYHKYWLFFEWHLPGCKHTDVPYTEMCYPAKVQTHRCALHWNVLSCQGANTQTCPTLKCVILPRCKHTDVPYTEMCYPAKVQTHRRALHWNVLSCLTAEQYAAGNPRTQPDWHHPDWLTPLSLTPLSLTDTTQPDWLTPLSLTPLSLIDWHHSAWLTPLSLTDTTPAEQSQRDNTTTETCWKISEQNILMSETVQVCVHCAQTTAHPEHCTPPHCPSPSSWSDTRVIQTGQFTAVISSGTSQTLHTPTLPPPPSSWSDTRVMQTGHIIAAVISSDTSQTLHTPTLPLPPPPFLLVRYQSYADWSHHCCCYQLWHIPNIAHPYTYTAHPLPPGQIPQLCRLVTSLLLLSALAHPKHCTPLHLHCPPPLPPGQIPELCRLVTSLLLLSALTHPKHCTPLHLHCPPPLFLLVRYQSYADWSHHCCCYQLWHIPNIAHPYTYTAPPPLPLPPGQIPQLCRLVTSLLLLSALTHPKHCTPLHLHCPPPSSWSNTTVVQTGHIIAAVISSGTSQTLHTPTPTLPPPPSSWSNTTVVQTGHIIAAVISSMPDMKLFTMNKQYSNKSSNFHLKDYSA